jgi:hypothetical protein
VSYAEVVMGSGPYVEQRLDSRGVLGGLEMSVSCFGPSKHTGRTILECWEGRWACSLSRSCVAE